MLTHTLQHTEISSPRRMFLQNYKMCLSPVSVCANQDWHIQCKFIHTHRGICLKRGRVLFAEKSVSRQHWCICTVRKLSSLLQKSKLNSPAQGTHLQEILSHQSKTGKQTNLWDDDWDRTGCIIKGIILIMKALHWTKVLGSVLCFKDLSWSVTSCVPETKQKTENVLIQNLQMRRESETWSVCSVHLGKL